VVTPELETLAVRVDGAIGTLELNRPDRLNAMSRVMLRELRDAAHWFDGQRVKVVVVRGRGRAFSAGFDLHDFSNPDEGTSLRDGADLGRQMADAVTDMDALTIAAVQGHCVGGGVVLAAACDLRVAATSAVFSIPEVDLGIPLAWGGIPRLVRELGPALTKDLVLTCRPVAAEEARALRFVNQVAADGELDRTVDGLAALLATRSTLTLRATKHHVNAVAEEMGSTAGAHQDADVLVSALHDPESRAAGRAYLDRRSRS
jgi:enoyl-CoA hydratase/carnithine racemase